MSEKISGASHFLDWFEKLMGSVWISGLYVCPPVMNHGTLQNPLLKSSSLQVLSHRVFEKRPVDKHLSDLEREIFQCGVNGFRSVHVIFLADILTSEKPPVKTTSDDRNAKSLVSKAFRYAADVRIAQPPKILTLSSTSPPRPTPCRPSKS